jgi:hypothetical protein
MPSDQELSDQTIEAIREYVPKLKVIKKESSWMHRAIGSILKVFGNPDYMNRYYTTIGYTIALPKGMKFMPWRTAWHEGGHGVQARKNTRGLFGALYLQGTPVWLVFAALTCWPFFVWLPWWSGLIYLAAFTLLSFPPFGFWRARWEFQMYGLSLAVRHWNGYTINDEYIDGRVKEFTKSFYFWMCPFPKYARKKLRQALEDAKTGELFKKRRYGSYYASAYKTMKKQGLVKNPPKVEPGS